MVEKHAYDFDLRLDDPVSTHAVQFRMIPTGARALDVGCHTGILGEALRAQKHCEVTGIDNDANALAAAATRLNNVLELDLEKPDWVDRLLQQGFGNFDIILFGDVIEHTREPLAILKSAQRLLKTEGKIIVSLPNVANLRVRIGLLFGKFDYSESGILDRSHIRFFTLRTARAMVRDAGYEIERESYSGYSLPRWLIDQFPKLFAVNIILLASPRKGR